ncbi:hypothetical protein OAH34_01865 [bacterium]|nr:hypothetical protein [bacterium]
MRTLNTLLLLSFITATVSAVCQNRPSLSDDDLDSSEGQSTTVSAAELKRRKWTQLEPFQMSSVGTAISMRLVNGVPIQEESEIAVLNIDVMTNLKSISGFRLDAPRNRNTKAASTSRFALTNLSIQKIESEDTSEGANTSVKEILTPASLASLAATQGEVNDDSQWTVDLGEQGRASVFFVLNSPINNHGEIMLRFRIAQNVKQQGVMLTPKIFATTTKDANQASQTLSKDPTATNKE